MTMNLINNVSICQEIELTLQSTIPTKKVEWANQWPVDANDELNTEIATVLTENPNSYTVKFSPTLTEKLAEKTLMITAIASDENGRKSVGTQRIIMGATALPQVIFSRAYFVSDIDGQRTAAPVYNIPNCPSDPSD
jgi:hypothetical protein